jgi:hypothetical protein
MPTKRKRGKPEMLSRNVEIKSSSLTARISALHRKGDEPEIESQPWLELKGVLTEPVKRPRCPDQPLPEGQNGNRHGSASLVRSHHPCAAGAPVRHHLAAARVRLLMAMVLGNRLTHGHFYFTKPHYNSGLVVSASFSSELEE